jgi:hypothetical protein
LLGRTRVAARPVLRTAGVPIGALARLRCPASFALAGEIDQRARRLATDADAISARLHAVIGGLPAGALKAAVVGLRRAVFHGRMPATREWNAGVAAALPDSLAGALTEWTAALRAQDDLRPQLSGLLAAEIETTRVGLREIVRAPSFRRALAVASPALFDEATKWLADPTRAVRRPSLVQLSTYVARAATKTSPFSTFTSSGLAAWSDDGPAVHCDDRITVHGVLEMNGYLLQHVVSALCGGRWSSKLRLRVNPSATLAGDVVRFLGRPPAEPIVAIPATPAVRECLRLLAGPDGLTADDLRHRLGDRAERFLDHLVESGLLERVAPVPDLAADPLGELERWLAANGDDVHLVRRVRHLLRTSVPVDDVDAHVARLRAVRGALDALLARAGLSATSGLAAVHENAVATATVGRMSVRSWRPALDDLDIVRHVLAATDPALPYRLALGEFCVERFGPGSTVPVVALHDAVARELAREDSLDRSDAAAEIARFGRLGAPAVDSLAGSRLARLRELDRVRRELRRLMLSSPVVDSAIRVDPRTLHRAAAAWPGWLGAPPSVAFYLQVEPVGGSVRLILNSAHGGYGRGCSRVLHLIGEAGGTAFNDDEARTPGGALLAEFGGMFGFSLNVRRPSVPYEIDYPFTSSRRPAEQRIPVNDLHVVHDPALGTVKLVAKGLGAQVKALHLGMMADLMLPPAARMMAQAFGAGYYLHPSQPLPAVGTPAVPGTVTHVARVEVGRVVLRRARWIAPTPQVPARTKGDRDAEYLRRIVAWLREHGIPARCFVRAPVGQPGAGWFLDRSYKPAYVDFASWYLTLAFERRLERAGPVVIFEEALPSPEDALGVDPSAARVRELIVELTGAEAAGG